ncbi:MAG: OmpA family protein, partial [Flavobacteriales bacterium]
LSTAQESLQKKEDMLRALESDLNKKQGDIDAANKSLEEKQKRLEEVETLLAEQQKKSNALQKKLEEALLGYKDKGLTVTQKDGKVYVSMEAKLLFDPGSTAVDAEGKNALIKLAQAIESESDMQITVEGHTDSDEFRASTSPKDNWELSVLRATEVIKIILANSSVSPALLNASGRSQFHPVGDDKAKNRRIEVILEPKLDELYDMIDDGKQ